MEGVALAYFGGNRFFLHTTALSLLMGPGTVGCACSLLPVLEQGPQGLQAAVGHGEKKHKCQAKTLFVSPVPARGKQQTVSGFKPAERRADVTLEIEPEQAQNRAHFSHLKQNQESFWKICQGMGETRCSCKGRIF